jgi:hypothetical protein
MSEPTVRDVKLILRGRAVLQSHGLEDLPVNAAARRLREQTIRDLGRRQYLFSVLGQRAKWPAGDFTLFRGEQPITVPPNRRDEALVDFLDSLGPEHLPDRVTFEERGSERVWCI